MTSREAKDFLVSQVAQQAAIEAVPLSDLEKRMMYFTEDPAEVVEDPITLNEEFEAEYDTDEYEAKLSQLLRNAYQRAGSQDPSLTCSWDRAIETLRKGDHYILIMCDKYPWKLWSDKPASFLKSIFRKR